MEWLEQLIKAAFSWLPTESNVMFDGWGLAAVSALLSLFYARLRKAKPDSSQHYASEYLSKNRIPLLHRLRKDLDSRFSSFLLDRSPLELTKTVAPNEVNHPRSLQDSIACVLERDGTVLETTNQPVAALFDRPDVGRRLAILGKPGSGKTVCLLTLLEHLLHEAEADAAAPLPLLFECSEWDGQELPRWMAWQLHRRYAFPEDTACQLVQAGYIFPLFDGLDELAAGKQEEFIWAFNVFADNRPLVLCCRIEEYRHLREHTGQKLSLNTALILQDISPQQIEGHLRQQGLDALWEMLAQSENRLHAAQRPLFLGLMIAVADKLRQGFRLRQDETWEDCIWRLYLDQCLDETQASWNKSPDCYGAKYSQEQSMHWLHCLARWMRKEQKVELCIDELQPTMLKDYYWFWIPYSIAISLLFGIAGGLFAAQVSGAALGLIPGLAFIVIGGRIYSIEIIPFRPLTYRQNLIFSVKNLPYWIILWVSTGFLLFKLVYTKNIFFKLLIVIYICQIPYFIFSLFSYLIFQNLKEMYWLTSETIYSRQRVNNALYSIISLSPVFVIAMIVFFIQTLFFFEHIGLAVSSLFSMHFFYAVLFVAVISSLFSLGADAIFLHYLLRLCLHLEGQLPFCLVPWLDAVQQRKVLQRTGGSYRFLHKQLQEYLAKQAAQ